MIVLDASAFLASVLPNQGTLASRRFFASPPAEVTSPAVLAIEVRNVLLGFERRGLLSPARCDEVLSLLPAVTLLQPWLGRDQDLIRVLGLARQQGVSFFDALYLDCCISLRATLVSRDEALIAAAAAVGVDIEDLR